MTRRLALGLGGFALVAAACGASEVSETMSYTDPEKLTLVQVPSDWHLYDVGELNDLTDTPFIESYSGFDYPAVVSTGFDGAPSRDVGNVATPLVNAAYPIGLMSVRTVGDVERQFLSRAALSQSILPYFQYLDAQEHVREDFTFGDGFDGIRLLVSYSDDSGAEVGVAYMISVTNPDDEKMYSIVAGCSRQCYIDNQAQIERVVDSWLVNKKAP
ncbi:MAG: hypothetical protein ACT4OP_11255 [Actinomycetota bacterium]